VMLAKEETVLLAKALSVGGAYMVTVGAAMATSVADAQIANIGGSKQTTVANSYIVEAGDAFTVKVGKASFAMSADGTITFTGTRINIGASGAVSVNGKDIDLN